MESSRFILPRNVVVRFVDAHREPAMERLVRRAWTPKQSSRCRHASRLGNGPPDPIHQNRMALPQEPRRKRELPQGGFFTTLVDGPDDGNDDFSLLVVKNSYDHAPCTRPALPPSQDGVKAENVTFILDSSMGGATSLAVWYSNFERETPVLFRQQPDIKVGSDGSFTITVEPGDFYTISTVRTARRGSFDTPVPPSQPRAPFHLPMTLTQRRCRSNRGCGRR